MSENDAQDVSPWERIEELEEALARQSEALKMAEDRLEQAYRWTDNKHDKAFYAAALAACREAMETQP